MMRSTFRYESLAGAGPMRAASSIEFEMVCVCVGIRVNAERNDPALARGARDAHRDLAAVCDQEPPDHRSRFGLRFSRKARKPSCPSSLVRCFAIACAVNSSDSSCVGGGDVGQDALGRRDRGRTGRQNFARDPCDRRIERPRFHDLVDESDRERAIRAEAFAGQT